jgi:hypothetical protein
MAAKRDSLTSFVTHFLPTPVELVHSLIDTTNGPKQQNSKSHNKPYTRCNSPNELEEGREILSNFDQKRIRDSQLEAQHNTGSRFYFLCDQTQKPMWA